MARSEFLKLRAKKLHSTTAGWKKGAFKKKKNGRGGPGAPAQYRHRGGTRKKAVFLSNWSQLQRLSRFRRKGGTLVRKGTAERSKERPVLF